MRALTYSLDFHTGKGKHTSEAPSPLPRIARLMALAIVLESRLRQHEFKDYAELARLSGVTSARMSQIMQLLEMAPDIQEQVLFLPAIKRLNERNLRTVLRHIEWHKQRKLFRKITDGDEGYSD